MSRNLVAPILALVLTASSVAPPVLAAPAPATWDNLVRVKSERMERVYLLPGADFRGYGKVMFDPTEAILRKGFKRDYNSTTIQVSKGLSDEDLEKILDEVRTDFSAEFKDALAKAGYDVVTKPGPDVLRVSTAVFDLYVNAPDNMSPLRMRSYSRVAGQATVIVEGRDSVTGVLLVRAVDERYVGDANGPRNSVSNRADFRQTFRSWAGACISGLAELKAGSPIAKTGSAK